MSIQQHKYLVLPSIASTKPQWYSPLTVRYSVWISVEQWSIIASLIEISVNSDVIWEKGRKETMAKGRRTLIFGHQYLDAMPLASRIIVPLEIERKESTQFREGNNVTKTKESNSEGEGKGHQCVDINVWTLVVVVFLRSAHCTDLRRPLNLGCSLPKKENNTWDTHTNA